VSSRGEGNPNPNKKISVSKNVLKIIKKKSTSPEAPKSNEAKIAVVKVSPLRGMMALNKNSGGDS
jgi:hypothetical protein